jgi:5-(carboxyamino)imidazole ribonucleotide synthase
MKKLTFGITGGGQLALMLTESLRTIFNLHNIEGTIIIYDKEKEGCAHQFADRVIVGAYDDLMLLTEFAKLCDGGITTEFESVPAKAFEVFKQYTRVCPSPEVIAIGQDRLEEKRLAKTLLIKTPTFVEVTDATFDTLLTDIQFPALLKTRSGGYDGKNQWKVSTREELDIKWTEIKKMPCIIESLVDFAFELSVIVGRNSKGVAVCYPAFQNTHERVKLENGDTATLLRKTEFPGPNITEEINIRAQEIVLKIAQYLNLEGILAVEFFYTKDGKILFNEMAPRPHNSGHGTMVTHTASQFYMLASILVLDVVPTPQFLTAGTMTNIIGHEVADYVSSAPDTNTTIKLYGKEPRDGRKVGHHTTIIPQKESSYGIILRLPQEG